MEQPTDSQTPPTTPPPTATVPRRSIVRRTVRLLLHRFFYAGDVIARPLRRYAGFLVLIVALLGVIGWMSAQLWMPQSVAATPSDTRVAAIAQAPAVEDYIKGRSSFNADLIWSSFSSSFQQNRIQNGQSKEAIQAQVDQERAVGIQYVSFDYIGGVDLEDGGKMYFYSTTFQVQNQQAEIPSTFRVDKDGKVTAIYAVEPMQLLSSN